jgi:hypothetical protein
MEGTEMTPHTTIRMVERADGEGYRQVSEAELRRIQAASGVRLEGVDGDEDANSVTYWYTRDPLD